MIILRSIRNRYLINQIITRSYATKLKSKPIAPPQGDPSLSNEWVMNPEQARKEFEDAEKIQQLYLNNNIPSDGPTTNYHTEEGLMARNQLKLSELPKVLAKGAERLLQNSNKEEIRQSALKIFSSYRSQVNLSGNYSVPKSYQELKKRPHLNSASNRPELIQYGPMESLGYLGGIFPSHFGACRRVFDEIERRDPTFQPFKILDFGTGPGTALWAANQIWGQGDNPSLKEYMGIDISASMLETTQELFQQYETENIQFLGEIQLLPYLNYNSSPSTQSDLVVASYTLSELPNSGLRDEIIKVLWDHCKDTLVVIERGTPSGFEVVNRVRELLVNEPQQMLKEAAENGTELKEVPQVGHIVAPCPHQGACPMAKTFRWCHFQQKVQRPKFMMNVKNSKSNHEQHAFSYIVIKKNPPASDSPLHQTSEWSRVIDQPTKRGQHVILNLCTKDEKLERTVIPKSQGKGAYRDARKSRWGDMFPHNGKHGGIEMKMERSDQKFKSRKYDVVEYLDDEFDD